MLRDQGLTSPSGHYDLNRFATASDADLYRYVDRCIEGARILGQSYITWPFIDPPLRPIEPYSRVVARFNGIGQRIAKGGLQFAYHNHGFEFVEQGGRIPYDIVLRETDPALVSYQMDVYWVVNGGGNPVELLQRYPGRFKMFHVKDGKAPRLHRARQRHHRLHAIRPDAAFSGMAFRQGGNFAQDSMQSVADRAAYVKRYCCRHAGDRRATARSSGAVGGGPRDRCASRPR